MSGSVLQFDLTGTGTGVLQQIQVGDGPHTITAEGHPAFGGRDSAPSPLDYALGALASCTQVTGQIIAAGNKQIQLGNWDIKLESHLDNSVLVFGQQGTSNFRDATLDITVETNLDEQAFQGFATEVERRCPITTLFRGSGVDYTTSWTNVPLS